MKREASIHITEKTLHSLVLAWGTHNSLKSAPKVADSLVEFVMMNAKRYSLRSRNILANTERTSKRVNKLQSSSKIDAMMFSRMLVMIRRKHKHKGIKAITERDGVQWEYINQAAGLAKAFCDDFELEYKSGVGIYIELGIKLLKPFTINRFKAADDRLRNYFSALKRIDEDENKETTNLIYEFYQARLSEKTGITLDYKDNPTEYCYFIDAAAICKEIQLHAKHFVYAQFDQLDWTNGYPSPSQLGSFKAKERALKWMTENNIKLKQKQKKLNNLQLNFMKKHEDNS